MKSNRKPDGTLDADKIGRESVLMLDGDSLVGGSVPIPIPISMRTET